MIRAAPTVAVLALLTAACAGTQPLGALSSRADAERQILLTVQQKDLAALGLTGPPGKRYLRRRAYRATPAVERTLNQLAREHNIERLDGWPIRSLDAYCEVFEVPENISLDDVIARLMEDPRVDLVQRMNIFETLISRYDDPYADLQSAVLQLGVEEAHQLSTGKGVLIAVIDSAVDSTHPELKGRVSITRDLVDSRKSPKGGEIHGTAVAGVIASTVNNKEGIIGIAPDVSIAALRACWPVGEGSSTAQCSSFSLAQALEVALDISPGVINLSLAGPFDPLLSQLLDEAIKRGIIVVAAQPEAHQANSGFPASHAKVIVARSASAQGDALSPYLLGAPATEILTTTPHGGYAFFSGNSMAAAHISGVIVLLMERDPALDVDQIAALLGDTMIHSANAASINACRAVERLTDVPICGQQIEIVSF